MQYSVYCCRLQVITSTMITILEPSVQFLGSLWPHHHNSVSVHCTSTVGLSQVSTFLHVFSALLSDHFTHDQNKLKSLGGCYTSRSSVASAKSRQSIECCSADHGLSMSADSLSNASDDRSALMHLLAFAYIWGFGSSLLDRFE